MLQRRVKLEGTGEAHLSSSSLHGRAAVMARGGKSKEALLWRPGSALSLSYDVPLEGSQLMSTLATAGSCLFLFPSILGRQIHVRIPRTWDSLLQVFE